MSEWISIAESYPANNSQVLVWRAAPYDSALKESLFKGRVCITRFRLTAEGPWWDSDTHIWRLVSSLFILRVSHWMPLPAGPKKTPYVPKVEPAARMREAIESLLALDLERDGACISVVRRWKDGDARTLCPSLSILISTTPGPRLRWIFQRSTRESGDRICASRRRSR